MDIKEIGKNIGKGAIFLGKGTANVILSSMIFLAETNGISEGKEMFQDLKDIINHKRTDELSANMVISIFKITIIIFNKKILLL